MYESFVELLKQENRFAYLCIFDSKNESQVHKLVTTTGSESIILDKETGEEIDLDDLDDEIEVYISPIN